MSDIKISAVLIAEEASWPRGLDEKDDLALVEKIIDKFDHLGEIKSQGRYSCQNSQGGDIRNEGGLSSESKGDMRSSLFIEPIVREICIKTDTSCETAVQARDMTNIVSHTRTDVHKSFEQSHVQINDSHEGNVPNKSEQLVVKSDGKRRPPDIKKPIRKKLRDMEHSGCSSSEGELERISSQESLDGDAFLKESGSTPVPLMDPPPSPLVVQESIGSIKDKVNALQTKVDEEAFQKHTKVKNQEVKVPFTPKKDEEDLPELPKVPKSPRSQTERLEETMSVKDLMKAFQTGQDPSKRKSGLFEHKSVTSSSLPVQESSPEFDSHIQIQSSTVLEQQSDVIESKQTDDPGMAASTKKAVPRDVQKLSPEKETMSVKELMKTFGQEPTKTKLGLSEPKDVDDSISKVKFNLEESGEIVSNKSCSLSKTVTFADTVECDDGAVVLQRETPELLAKETTSVKELMKTFQTEQNSVITSFSTLSSKTVTIEEKKQVKVTLVQELEIQNEDISEKSQIFSDHADFEDAVKTISGFQCDERRVLPQSNDFMEKTTVMIHLEEPVTGIDRSLSFDAQISPDRRPSEDFSADIKAELEESPEYQVFKQTVKIAKENNQMEVKEEDNLDNEYQEIQLSSLNVDMEVNLEKGLPSADNQNNEETNQETPLYDDMTKSSAVGGSSVAKETHQMSSAFSTDAIGREECTEFSQGEEINRLWVGSETRESKTSLRQTITDTFEDVKLQEVYIERKTFTKTNPIVKDISGMLSLMSNDLDQCLQTRLAEHETSEAVVQEKCEETILSKNKDKESITEKATECDTMHEGGDATCITEQSMKEESVEMCQDENATNFTDEPFEEQWDERRISFEPCQPKVKNMSGMLSLLNSDLDSYLTDKPVQKRPLEEGEVLETFEEVTLTKSPRSSDYDWVTEAEEETDLFAVKDIKQKSAIEPQLQEVCIPGTAKFQSFTGTRNMSGMESLLSKDLDEYFDKNLVTTQYQPVDEIVNENYEQVILTRKTFEDRVEGEVEDHLQTNEVGSKASSPSSLLEEPFQEVYIKQNPLQSTIEKDGSGMLSLLSTDLDHYLKDKIVTRQSQQEEDLVCESYEQCILTINNIEDKVESIQHPKSSIVEVKEVTSAADLETTYLEDYTKRKTQQEKLVPTTGSEDNLVHESCRETIKINDTLEGKMDEEEGEDYHNVVMGVTESTPTEIPFQEVCIKKTTKQPAAEKDISGMLSLLSADLEQHFNEEPKEKQCVAEEEYVDESCTQIIVTKSVTRETHGLTTETRLPDETELDILETDKKVLDSDKEAYLIEDDGSDYVKSKDGEAGMSPDARIPSDEYTEMVDFTKQYTSESFEDAKKVVVTETHAFLEQPSGLGTAQRPADLGILNTVISNEPVKETCQQDSLEATPVKEDSSVKSPDSIEPSSTEESPCRDSLEGSPTKPKDYETTVPPRLAVYEDYASQLQACYEYNKNVYDEESVLHEQENSLINNQMKSPVYEDQYSITATKVTDDSISEPGMCDDVMPIKQDFNDEQNSENDAVNKQLTPEEEMFKMAAKIKTFEEIEQEAKSKRDLTVEAADNRETELNLRCSPVTQTSLQDTRHETYENVENQTQLKTLLLTDSTVYVTSTQREDIHPESEENVSLSPEGDDQFSVCEKLFSNSSTDEHDASAHGLTLADGSDSTDKGMATVCIKELDSVIHDNEAVSAQLGAEERPDISQALSSVQSPQDKGTLDPFQFQEGKLFEMTRGGAIDMTRGGSEEEGQPNALFYEEEYSVNEVAAVDTGEAHSENTSETLEINDSFVYMTTHERAISPVTERNNEEIPPPVPRAVDALTGTSSEPLVETDLGFAMEVQLNPPNPVEKLTSVQDDTEGFETLGLEYLNSTVAELQSDTSTILDYTVTEHSQNSTDSSNDDDDGEDEDDQCSVIEMALSNTQTPVVPNSTTKEEVSFDKISQKRNKSSVLGRRSKSEADHDRSKAAKKVSRCKSDSNQFYPYKFPLVSTLQGEKSKDSMSTEIPGRPSLDIDDRSSASHKSPDSVIFAYDKIAMLSSDSDGNQLPVVQTSSGTEDVFESRPSWDDTVETQMQRISDDQTPECMPGMARLE